MNMDATISECGLYRYRLTREWDPFGKSVNFIMLNPSTADANQDDPTIRRCIGFAQKWNYGKIVVTNLFALRATDPKELRNDSIDPVGSENNSHIEREATSADLIVAAWGNHGGFKDRHSSVYTILSAFDIRCLGITKTGHPKHPLYVPGDTELLTWKLQ